MGCGSSKAITEDDLVSSAHFGKYSSDIPCPINISSYPARTDQPMTAWRHQPSVCVVVLVRSIGFLLRRGLLNLQSLMWGAMFAAGSCWRWPQKISSHSCLCRVARWTVAHFSFALFTSISSAWCLQPQSHGQGELERFKCRESPRWDRACLCCCWRRCEGRFEVAKGSPFHGSWPRDRLLQSFRN